MKTLTRPAPGADVIICGWCLEDRVDNGLGALVCPHCDCPPDPPNRR